MKNTILAAALSAVVLSSMPALAQPASGAQANLEPPNVQEFDKRMAQAQENMKKMIGFITALSNVIYTATDIEEFNSLESRWAVAKVHRKVVEAIRDKDDAAARRRMERHVQAYSKAVAPHAPSKITIE